MGKSIELKAHVNETKNIVKETQCIEVKEKTKYLVAFTFAAFVLLSSFIFNSPYEILQGMGNIILAPSILITDYMVVGNIGAALFNSGTLMIVVIIIAKQNKVNMNGSIIAAMFTIGGFALFGKNIYNIWAIIIGVYLHSIFQKERFSKYILIALFGTALGPMISQVSFGLGFSLIEGIIFANLSGVIVGFVLPPLCTHFVNFHQGFNLYNIGFTTGMIGTVFMAFFRAFGLQNESTLIVAEGYNYILGSYLFLIFITLIIMGVIFNNKGFNGYTNLLRHTGRPAADYVTLSGFGLSLINMGLLGLITTGYVLLVGGELNGPVIGGVFTVVGFGAFGKHTKNITPILIGVYIASLLQIWDTNSTGALLAALFGTTLAPIAGQFGWKAGIVAGFSHMAMVMNVGYLHGGMNLYNNGFSGGMVAAVLVPIIDSIRKK